MNSIRLALLLICYSVSLNAQDWRQVKSSNSSIELAIDLDSQGDSYRIKASSILSLPISQIEALIESPESYPKWLYRYEEAELLLKEKNNFVFKAIIGAPIPLKDRKIKVKVTKTANFSDTVLFSLENQSFSKDSEYCKRCIAVESLTGSWELFAIASDKTKVVHEMEMQLKVPLPRNIIYRLMLKGPTKSFENLQALTKKAP